MENFSKEQQIAAYNRKVQALGAYFEFQNRQINIITQYVENGGEMTTVIQKRVEEIQKKGLSAFRAYIDKQNKIIKELM